MLLASQVCHAALQACLDVGRSVLFTGTTGVGKSVITIDALEHLCTSKGLLPYTINFSAQTTSLDTQVRVLVELPPACTQGG